MGFFVFKIFNTDILLFFPSFVIEKINLMEWVQIKLDLNKLYIRTAKFLVSSRDISLNVLSCSMEILHLLEGRMKGGGGSLRLM